MVGVCVVQWLHVLMIFAQELAIWRLRMTLPAYTVQKFSTQGLHYNYRFPGKYLNYFSATHIFFGTYWPAGHATPMIRGGYKNRRL